MFRCIKQVLITLLIFNRSLANMVNVSNFTTCIPLNNQPCITGPTLIDLNLDDHNHVQCS